MILKVFLLFCIVYAVTGKHVKVKSPPKSVPLLRWNTNYSVEARKYYMASSLIENFKYWRLDSRSRLEANDGASIKITIGTKSGKGKYEIHPETTEEEINKIVCVKSYPYPMKPDDLLPSLGEFTEQGRENIKGIDCIKFTNKAESDKENERTLWVYYDNTTDVWIPVRYKLKEIDERHGYLKNYVIWDYFNFKKGVNPDIFNVPHNCTSKEYHKKKIKERSSVTKNTHKLQSNIAEKKGLKNKFTIDKEIIKDKESQRKKLWKVGNIPFPYSKAQVKKLAAELPKEYDLRLQGFVGPVINRQECSSAWAIAATAAVEGAVARSNGGTWIKLSEQALIDCSWGYGNKGCTTGHPTASYPWIMEHGLPTEQNYGIYANKNGFCKMENMTKTFKIKGYTNVTPLSVEALKIALINYGPIVVHVNAFLSDLYDGGVHYESACDTFPTKLTDFITLVGYGEKDGDTFWILKDSKGPYSGIDGYIHISSRNNNCGVMTEPTYVVA